MKDNSNYVGNCCDIVSYRDAVSWIADKLELHKDSLTVGSLTSLFDFETPSIEDYLSDKSNYVGNCCDIDSYREVMSEAKKMQNTIHWIWQLCSSGPVRDPFKPSYKYGVPSENLEDEPYRDFSDSICAEKDMGSAPWPWE